MSGGGADEAAFEEETERTPEELDEEVAESNPAGPSDEDEEKGRSVTSFIVSEEPSASTKPRVLTSSDDPNEAAVVPFDDLGEGEMCASWLEKESTLPAPAENLVDREPVFQHPTEPRCTLKGAVATNGVINGRWGMTQQAHQDEAQTSKFEYRRKAGRGQTVDVAGLGRAEVAVALSGAYAGYFNLQVPGKSQPLKCDEKAMSLEFVLNAEGSFNVRGFGKNKYGNFEIDGTCSADLGELTMFRVYVGKATPRAAAAAAPASVPAEPGAPPPRKQSGKDLNRVQAALTSTSSSTLKRSASMASDRGGLKLQQGGGVVEKPSKKAKQQQQPPKQQQLEQASPAASALPLGGGFVAGEGSKRASARSRKAPSHLRGSPEQRTSAAVQALPEALRKCHAVVCQLERATGAHWFMTEVDPVALGVLHYRSIVRNPMDFGTVKRRLEDGLLADADAFAAEMRLVFRNAMTFNVLPEAPVHEAARDLHEKFEEAMRTLWRQLAGPTDSSSKDPKGILKKRRAVDGGDLGSLGGGDGDDDVSAGSSGKRPRGKGKAGKTTATAKRGPRFDDGPATGGDGESTVPMAEFVRLQKQMESMQETIANLQKTTAQTEVTLQTSIENAASAGKPSAAAKRAAKMKLPLTFQEKAQLSEDINNLPPERLSHVIKIIQERMVLAPTGDSEVEIDIESMDTETLRSLQNYVKTAKRKSKSASAATKPKPKKPTKASEQHVAVVPEEGAGAPLEPTTTLEDIALGAGFAAEDDEDDLAFALGA